ncbi:hypothetical protein [Streptomyces kanamyceticus]|uniref:DUF559 domain-containing protein n=1 Tax=Streptomyces kanamyceticus TaxID=1967 RepID=A0A5J6GDJ4_STRKN|nr:hypothetical protein [Streptomyces kanamyceticus]QEU93263.1 hypothetical protein CP970_22125 [Streptomyces kanamyceticus]
MSDDLRSLDQILANPEGLSESELDRLRGEQVLGAAATLLHRQGDAETAGIAVDVTTAHLTLWDSDFGIDTYKAVLEVEPHLLPRFTEEAQERIREAMRTVTARNRDLSVGLMEVLPTIPEVSVDWRKQLRAATGPSPTNQARRVRLEPQHPMEDGLHFTNVWEQGVYRVLKERQAALPDDDTIGIVPLGAMRVRGHTYEPDLLVTYRGRAGVIEIDGPHHKERASSDKSRDRLMQNAGVHYVDRLDVRDSTKKEEVEKFVATFLKRLGG